MCEVWLHAECEGLRKKDYDYFVGKGSAMYVCGKCKKEVRGAKIKMDKLMYENEGLRKENEKIMKMMNDIVEEMREMKGVIKRELKDELLDEIEEKMRVKVGVGAGVEAEHLQQEKQISMVSNLKREVLDTVKEEDEKRKRDCNVVVHGMTRTEICDRDRLEAMMRDVMELEDVRMEEVNRLGKGEVQGNGKPKSILVRFETPGQKWAVVGRAKRLRNAGEGYRRIMIVPDLTVKERFEDKKLREELRRRRDDGENDIFISKGKIIKKNKDRNNNNSVIGEVEASGA